jgi:hypothetical protein
MPSVNPGPAVVTTPNTQSPRSLEQTIQTIAVSLTPLIVATITTAEQSFGANGVSQATAATGILAGDVILGISAPSLVAGVGIAGFRVDTTVNDKFYITFVNPTAGGVTPVSGIYLITVARFNNSASGEGSPGVFGNLPTTVTTN